MKSDKQLGMDRPITRRDLLHDATVAALGLGLPLSGSADTASPAVDPTVYPPTRTGLRGSHPGSFEAAHKYARDGAPLPSAKPLNEHYDLIVVGAGISGLAAAQFYQKKYGKNARILLLENHDDFGGHARRNEFHQGGTMRLALGGTHNLEYWNFSKTVQRYLKDLGVNVKAMRSTQEFAYGESGDSTPAIWFDEETYGENKLVRGLDVARVSSKKDLELIDSFPLSAEAREQLKRFYTMRKNIFDDMSEAETEEYLWSQRYVDFLRDYGGLGDEALQLFAKSTHGGWGTELRNLAVAEGIDAGMPGKHLMGGKVTADDWEYPAAHFPDGNASVARLQVHALIPDVAPGTTADNVAVQTFDYSKLDRETSAVRLRLSATVMHAENTADGVAVDYLKGGELLRVTARHCVMACYHCIIPHLCPDMPAAQREAQKYQVKVPLVLTNVLLRSSEAMDKLGIAGVDCPGRTFASVFLYRGFETGGYQHKLDDDGPVALTFWGMISPPEDINDPKEQNRASRMQMLAMSFDDYEREVRTVLDGMLGPVGFDVQKDILAITVNRWPHGYSHEYLGLWDPDFEPGKAPHNIASKPFGNITIANSDAGAYAYTHGAIDEAYRAVQELG
ncbi:MAG: NAD(P)-binding protein [Pseudomonadota bacterium]